MTAPVREFSPATKKRSADCLLRTALGKVPQMVRDGATTEALEEHILIAALLADELYADAAVGGEQ